MTIFCCIKFPTWPIGVQTTSVRLHVLDNMSIDKCLHIVYRGAAESNEPSNVWVVGFVTWKVEDPIHLSGNQLNFTKKNGHLKPGLWKI